MGTKTQTGSIETTLHVIGGKWKILIVWNLKGKTLRYNEIKRCIEGITHKMLAQKLRELESDGIINRKVYAVVPPKVEYSLTDHGISLIPILDKMCEWGHLHMTFKKKIS